MTNLILITLPDSFPNEATICNALFRRGLQTLHLRKPSFAEADYRRFLNAVDTRFRNRIVIHDFFHLVTEFGLKGIHLSTKKQPTFVRKPWHKQVSASCHSFNEIRNLPFKADYCFLSPVFDSISKTGYKSGFSEDEIRGFLKETATPVIALGGVCAENLPRVWEMGFSGAAILGAIWNENADMEHVLQRWQAINAPKVLSVAGFDPSSGAGITSDIKTMEATGSYGLGVCSGITIQNQDELRDIYWVSIDEINKQCGILFEKNRPQFIKIGIVESLSVLNRLCENLLKTIPEAKIIWDPVLQSSSGYNLHNDLSLTSSIFEKIFLVTPNTPEMHRLFGAQLSHSAIQSVCKLHNMNILWKGGHNGSQTSEDILFTQDKVVRFSVVRGGTDKHGTGCVYSSALASFLAQGFSLETACSKAQLYISDFLCSSSETLGFHQRNIGAKPSINDVKLMFLLDFDEKITLAEQAENACRGGANLIQLRMKQASDAVLLKQGRLVKSVCDRHNALFIVNDNPHVARQLDADGVHLGKQDMPPAEARAMLGNDKIIGATCNTFQDIAEAYKNGADYVGVGPFRFTATKKNLSPILGLEGYRGIINQMNNSCLNIPVFAIGGITSDDVKGLLACGIQGIALSSYIKNSGDIENKTAAILQQINENK